MVIFNRSHYEDVLVVRVHNLVPEEVWSRRYDQINAFEKELVEDNTHILKFYLHISKQEQLSRFKERLDDPAKQWKISESDYKERKFWDDYTAAYEDVLSRCSTEHAPWFVIPSDHKWFRNLAIARIVVEHLEGLDMKFPHPRWILSIFAGSIMRRRRLEMPRIANIYPAESEFGIEIGSCHECRTMLVTPGNNNRNRTQALALAGVTAVTSAVAGWFFPLRCFSGALSVLLLVGPAAMPPPVADLKQPFPASWEQILQSHVAFFERCQIRRRNDSDKSSRYSSVKSASRASAPRSMTPFGFWWPPVP